MNKYGRRTQSGSLYVRSVGMPAQARPLSRLLLDARKGPPRIACYEVLMGLIEIFRLARSRKSKHARLAVGSDFLRSSM